MPARQIPASSRRKAVASGSPAQPSKATAPAKAAKPARPATSTKASTPAAAVGVPKAKIAKPAAPEKAAKKPAKLRLVRDSFTMPEADFALIAALKSKALGAQRETKKSEVLRAGLRALAALDTPALIASLGQLEPVKIGRPRKGHF